MILLIDIQIGVVTGRGRVDRTREVEKRTFEFHRGRPRVGLVSYAFLHHEIEQLSWLYDRNSTFHNLIVFVRVVVLMRSVEEFVECESERVHVEFAGELASVEFGRHVLATSHRVVFLRARRYRVFEACQTHVADLGRVVSVD